MLSATARFGDFRIDVFSSEGSEHPNQDRWLLLPRSDGSIRVAVIDGVTPWRNEPVPAGDSGQFSASVVQAALNLPWPIKEAFAHANRELHSPALRPLGRQAMAAAVAVDISKVLGRLDCSGMVAADCEWWATEADQPLVRFFIGGEGRTAIALAAAQERSLREPAAPDRDSQREREAEDFGSPDAFHRHAIGLCPHPKFTTGEGRFTSIVLASDGARLGEAPEVSAHPESLRAWLEYVESSPTRDDFTMLIVALDQR